MFNAMQDEVRQRLRITTRALTKLTNTTPPIVLRAGKRTMATPRFVKGVAIARWQFRTYRSIYRNRYLFIAGLPKSGTSWIETMLASYPGYTLIAHPEITKFDYEHNGTHRFEMRQDFFTRLGDALCVIKIHCHGSANNVRILHEAGIPYCVLYRDLRDAAVSHVSYVRRTPWHPEYPTYQKLDTRKGLQHFGRTLLPEWRDWIHSWNTRRDRNRSLEMTYEQMLTDTAGSMKKVVRLFQLPEEPLERIIDTNRFGRLENTSTFFRKGRSGDWVNHFDAELKDQFKSVIGEDLVRWGYERNLDW